MCLHIIVLWPIMASQCSVKVEHMNNSLTIIGGGSPTILFLHTPIERGCRGGGGSAAPLRSTYLHALMNEASDSIPASRNTSARGAAASVAALLAAAASVPPALVPGTLGHTHQLLLSVALTAMSAFSLLRQAFLVGGMSASIL